METQIFVPLYPLYQVSEKKLVLPENPDNVAKSTEATRMAVIQDIVTQQRTELDALRIVGLFVDRGLVFSDATSNAEELHPTLEKHYALLRQVMEDFAKNIGASFSIHALSRLSPDLPVSTSISEPFPLSLKIPNTNTLHDATTQMFHRLSRFFADQPHIQLRGDEKSLHTLKRFLSMHRKEDGSLEVDKAFNLLSSKIMHLAALPLLKAKGSDSMLLSVERSEPALRLTDMVEGLQDMVQIHQRIGG